MKTTLKSVLVVSTLIAAGTALAQPAQMMHRQPVDIAALLNLDAAQQ